MYSYAHIFSRAERFVYNIQTLRPFSLCIFAFVPFVSRLVYASIARR